MVRGGRFLQAYSLLLSLQYMRIHPAYTTQNTDKTAIYVAVFELLIVPLFFPLLQLFRLFFSAPGI